MRTRTFVEELGMWLDLIIIYTDYCESRDQLVRPIKMEIVIHVIRLNQSGNREKESSMSGLIISTSRFKICLRFF